jgi:WD40 repeat protein
MGNLVPQEDWRMTVWKADAVQHTGADLAGYPPVGDHSRCIPVRTAGEQRMNSVLDDPELTTTLPPQFAPRLAINTHSSALSAVVTSDGTWVVSSGQDGSVRVWDLITGALVGEPSSGTPARRGGWR